MIFVICAPDICSRLKGLDSFLVGDQLDVLQVLDRATMYVRERLVTQT